MISSASSPGGAARDRPGAPDWLIAGARGPVLADPPGGCGFQLGSGARVGVGGRDIGLPASGSWEVMITADELTGGLPWQGRDVLPTY